MFNLLIKEHFKNVASCEKEEHEEKVKLVSNRLGQMGVDTSELGGSYFYFSYS